MDAETATPIPDDAATQQAGVDAPVVAVVVVVVVVTVLISEDSI